MRSLYCSSSAEPSLEGFPLRLCEAQIRASNGTIESAQAPVRSVPNHLNPTVEPEDPPQRRFHTTPLRHTPLTHRDAHEWSREGQQDDHLLMQLQQLRDIFFLVDISLFHTVVPS